MLKVSKSRKFGRVVVNNTLKSINSKQCLNPYTKIIWRNVKISIINRELYKGEH